MQSSVEHMHIGHGTVHIKHEDFLPGHQEGYQQYYRHYVQRSATVSTTTLLFLTRNGFASGVSATWNAGYITGWFTALYECVVEEKSCSTQDTECRQEGHASSLIE